MKKLIVLMIMVLALAIGFYSCGGGGGEETSTGTVALYATDNKIKAAPQGVDDVKLKIDSVSLLNTGTNASCSLLTTQTLLDLSELSDTIQLLSVSGCQQAQFNRIHVVFDQSLTVTINDTESDCTFVSFKDESNTNTLNCSGGTCSLDVNGAVNVFANQPGKIALDFVLKDFEVSNFPGSGCTATMKMFPLNASDIDNKKNQGFQEAVTGTISNLNTSAKTFTITKGNTHFTVNYSGVTQQGIDQLLLFAQDNGLKVQVKTADIDLGTKTITASEIFVKIEGTISDLTSTTFTLNGAPFVSITVDYIGAEVEGILANGETVEVKLFGFDGAEYPASEVEVGETEVED